jgi:hypothetical protein
LAKITSPHDFILSAEIACFRDKEEKESKEKRERNEIANIIRPKFPWVYLFLRCERKVNPKALLKGRFHFASRFYL